MVVCDDPLVAEVAYDRHKYLHRLLCWISPQSLYTSILDKQRATGPTLPLRVLTATLADRVASLVHARPVTSPNKADQQVGIAQCLILTVSHAMVVERFLLEHERWYGLAGSARHVEKQCLLAIVAR